MRQEYQLIVEYELNMTYKIKWNDAKLYNAKKYEIKLTVQLCTIIQNHNKQLLHDFVAQKKVDK